MRTEGAVQYKLKQVCYRHRKRLIEKNLRPLPSNCKFNGEPVYPEEVPEAKRSSLARICFYEGEVEWGGTVCDGEFGGSLLAKRCPCFQAKQTSEEVKENFAKFLRTADIGDIAIEYPDIAALWWVLELAPEAFMDDPQESEDEQEPPADNVSSTE